MKVTKKVVYQVEDFDLKENYITGMGKIAEEAIILINIVGLLYQASKQMIDS